MTTTGEAAERESQTGTPRFLRVMNERGLLEYLRLNGPRSRAQLARETGLSKPTVSQALANLERAGLVRVIGQVGSQRGGRQAVLYEPDPTAGYVVGVDIGRSWVRVALADLAGTIVARSEEQNEATSALALIEMVNKLAHHTVASADLPWSQVIHLVVGTPGFLDPTSERLLYSHNLPEWDQPGLVDLLREALGQSLTVENDSNLAALGERTFGCGLTANTFVYLLIGTGVGMGIVIDGALYRGTHGAGGEIGFLPLGMHGDREVPMDASAHRRGMLEDATSAEGVVREAMARGMSSPVSAKQVFDAARAGDEVAQAVVAWEGQQLALAIASVAAILDPEIIVLGGGVGRNVDVLRAPIEQRLREITPFQPRIIASELDGDAVLLGAIATALTVARDLVFQQRS